MMPRTKAIVRKPSPGIADGQVTHIDRVPLDVKRALMQHEDYVSALASLGLDIVFAAEAPEFPDGVFVEDTLVMLDVLAVILRPGAPTRLGETQSILPLVSALGLESVAIVSPATVDGGDVLVTGRHVFVGQSTRSNAEAVRQFGAMAGPARSALGVPTERCLHLKTGITALPDGSLIGYADWIDLLWFRELGYVVHEAPEPAGADVLCVGHTVILPADAPQTGQSIRALGFDVMHVDISELQKIEAGVTCLSVLV